MAVGDYFLKIDSIPGESNDSKHKGEIELESFSWGAQQSGSASHGGGLGTGKVAFHDFQFVMRICKASPLLFSACSTGEGIKQAILTCRKAGKGQQEFLKVTFSDLLVSSFQTGAEAHSDVLPTDSITLNFTKIEFEYKEQKADGSLGASTKKFYDLKQQVFG